MFVTLGIKLNTGNSTWMGKLGCNNIFGVKVAFTKWMNIRSQKKEQLQHSKLEQRSPWAIEVTGKLWSSLVLPGSPQWYP
jgi:hypothetical protein